MKIWQLTCIAFQLNSALDSGHYDQLDIDQVANEIQAGTILTFLRGHLGLSIDLSILKPENEAELVAEWQDFLMAISADRKFGVTQRGLSLIIAYLIEGIQRRA